MTRTEVKFQTLSGGTQTILLQHLDDDAAIENYNDTPYDKAISGKLRQNFRGFRKTYTLKYYHSTEPEKIKSFIGNMIEDFENGADNIFISIGIGFVPVIPTDNFLYAAKYYDQIGKFPPKLKFIDYRPNVSFLGGWVEPGWVDPQWVVQ